MSGTRCGTRRGRVALVAGVLLAAAVAGPVAAQDTGTGTDDEGNTVAVGAPPPPPPPAPTTIVAVGQPPVPPPPPPPPTTIVVAVGEPPVPSTTIVASQPATLANRPIVERPAVVGLVGDTARAVAVEVERISALL